MCLCVWHILSKETTTTTTSWHHRSIRFSVFLGFSCVRCPNQNMLKSGFISGTKIRPAPGMKTLPDFVWGQIRYPLQLYLECTSSTFRNTDRNALYSVTYIKWFALLTNCPTVMAVLIPVQPVTDEVPTFPTCAVLSSIPYHHAVFYLTAENTRKMGHQLLLISLPSIQ